MQKNKNIKKRKAVVFYTYLPPWRIDVFNEMGKLFDLKIIFLNTSSEGFKYNRDRLSSLLNVSHFFWDRGITIKGKTFRTGIVNFLVKEKPDIIFSHEYSPTSILLAICKKFKKFNFTFIITTSDNLKMAESVKGLKRVARKFVLSEAKGVVVYGKNVQKYYRTQFPHLNIEICPNIQKTETLTAFRPLFGEPIKKYKSEYNLGNQNIILYVGRLVKVKGLDKLLNAFSKTECNNYKLVLIGEGEERSSLESQILELKLEEKVMMPGFFDGIDLYAWYDMANFLILPSIYEPFGAVVNEALSFGCPVIASKYIGALEFIDNDKNGYVFDPLNNEEFIKVLDNAMNLYQNEIKNRQNLMNHSFQHYIDSFKNVLSD